jgi:hypothetical protein
MNQPERSYHHIHILEGSLLLIIILMLIWSIIELRYIHQRLDKQERYIREYILKGI